MPVKELDIAALKRLRPLDTLKRKSLATIAKRGRLVQARPGETLFRRQDKNDDTIYILEGAVTLSDDESTTETIEAGTEQARDPLSPAFPRKHMATAVGHVSYLRISSELMDQIFTWDQTGIYQVEEIGSSATDSGDDWMVSLMQLDILQRIPAANIQALFSRFKRVDFSPGDTLIRQGDVGDHFYFIVAGRCQVTRESSADNGESSPVELGQGDTFGEDALVSGSERNATVTATSAGTAMRLGKNDFLKLLNEPVLRRVGVEAAAQTVANGGRWLDVRLPEEFDDFHFDGAVNVPLYSLRQRLEELDPKIDYIVCCDTGRQSSAAAFILSGRNFRAAVLAGGLDANRA